MTGPDLAAALAIRSPAECAALYRDWAASYDAGFAGAMDYRLPAHVAGAFLAAGGRGPVLDAGAGTGLLGAALRDLGYTGPIDGVDLSPEMLDRARAKGCYRALSLADLTGPMTPRPENGGVEYGGIVSSGTFTFGHVGPGALTGLLGIAMPGAVLALSVNEGVWDAAGWPAALAALEQHLTAMEVFEVPVYGAAAVARDAAHAGHLARIVVLTRA